MSYEWIGFALVLVVALAIAAAVYPRLPPALRNIFLIGLGLRIVGSTARYEVLYRVYHGVGDATGYFGHGRAYAEALRQLDFSIFDPLQWHAGNWWGTQFVRYVSGFVLSVTGPSLRAEFLAFSLLAFAGLCLFGLAFARAYPYLPVHRYLAWIWLWPSLWFWPSSVGKDALLLLAFGFVAAGWVGRRGRPSWLLLAAGMALTTAIRPHMAALVAVAIGTAQWMQPLRGRTLGAWVRTVVVAVGALFLVSIALSQLGLGEADLEGIQEFAQVRSQQTLRGGSAIATPGGGVTAIPMAFINVLARPFLWEAHNGPALIAALESTVLWVVVLVRRRRVWGALRHWRSDRFARLALPLAGAYVLLIGLVFGNLGIIARQRVAVFPFLFLFLEAIPPGYARLLWERRQAALERRKAADDGRAAARRALPGGTSV